MMGEFEIECKKIMRWAKEIDRFSKDVRKQEIRMADVIRRIRLKEGDYCRMEQALSGIADRLHGQQEQMRQYGGMLEHIAKAYESTETGIQEEGDGYLSRATQLRNPDNRAEH